MVAVLAGTHATASTPATKAQTDRAAIVRTLQSSAAAWSKRDLAGFMSAYADTPSTTYLKNDVVIRGYDAIKAMYAVRFKPEPRLMGQLSLAVLDVRALGPDYALCIGRFSLTMPQGLGVTSHGMFTLIFGRIAGNWKIVSDHTSS